MNSRDDSYSAIVARDRRWRERQEAWGKPGHYSCTNAARGSRDRMILLQRYRALELRLTYLDLLATLRLLPGHQKDLIAKAQKASDAVWQSMTAEQQKETEELLIDLDIFKLHRPRRHR